ncbi:zinc-dependent alcohol dehydrogenase family protein [Parasphingorhabdus sp. JC815]|uniref:zinc-dependent alcohol dehydrogenase family protein n=1 Tax=Parasphingorhabdus sp. JC815 TaxID=3232140 RepID=UPI00345906F5
MKIRAAVLSEMGAQAPYEKSQPLQIKTVELAPPGNDEVMVKIAAAGLCHSDLSVINGDRPRPMPMALGHEAAGIVAALGEGINDLAIGDHVVMTFMPSCGHCLPCAEGRPALCEPGAAANGAGELLSGGRRLTQDGDMINHHLGCSAFADYAVVSRRSLVKVDKNLSLEEAALFGCAVLTGVGAAINTAAIRMGQSAVIIGLGGVGLATVIGCLSAGVSKLIAVDLSPEKQELAKSIGATHVVNASDADAVEQVREITSGGADVAFEMAGSILALENAVAMTRRGGMTVTAGLPPPDQNLLVNVVSLVAEERTIKGSYIGSCVPVRDIPRYVEMYKAGKLPVDRLLSGYLELDEINAGFDRLQAGTAVRQIITFDHN